MDSEIVLNESCLNSNVMGSKKSATLNINEKSIKLQKQGKTVYRYGLGQSPFPVPNSVVDKLIKYSAEKDYLAVCGLENLRINIAKWLNRSEGTTLEAQDILIGPGSKQLLFMSGLVLDNALIVQSPCWVSYIPQARFLGKEVINIQTKYQNRWRVTPEQFEAACLKPIKGKARLLILTYPDNPTGLTYSEQELKALACIARKYKVIVLSDEIYGKTTFDQNHCSIARFYPEGTIISTGLSKWAGAGGWRLGFFAFPKQLRWMLNAMTSVASETYTSVSAPIQYAACQAFLQSTQISKYERDECRILKCLGLWVYNAFKSNTKVRTHCPQGGFYIYLDFDEYREKLAHKGIKTSQELTDQIMEETGCANLPSSSFGREPSELALRLAFVNFDGGAALLALEDEKVEVNEDFLRKHCGLTLEGIEKMVEWMKSL